jgi:16S rRNA (guanine1207-N2)-methyltransferase
VLGDSSGALTLGLAQDRGGAGPIRVYQDSVVHQRALAVSAAELGLSGAYAPQPLSRLLLEGAGLVVLRLPRSLAELDEIACAIAQYARPDVVVLAGGRIKHMSLSMNEVLARSFEHVEASLARQKSRVLRAWAPKVGVAQPFPVARRIDDAGLTVVAHGAAFAGAAVDIGTRALLSVLGQAPKAGIAVDLGCGTGVLAAAYARQQPQARVFAVDASVGAVRSAAATAEANGVGGRITTFLDDAGAALPSAFADLIVCNPPFHAGAALSVDTAERMFLEAGRILKPGGEIWTVFNSHLRYQRALRDAVGPTRQILRNPKFTVTASTKAS